MTQQPKLILPNKAINSLFIPWQSFPISRVGSLREITKPYFFLDLQKKKTMIQRIQSLFLLIVTILAVVLFFVPLAKYYQETGIFTLSLTGISSAVSGLVTVKISIWLSIAMMAISGVIAALSIWTILAYQDRKKQISFIRVLLMLTIVLVVIIFALTDHIRKLTGITPEYEMGIYFPLVSLAMLILAQRFIKKDDELVRSADRLR